MRKLNLKNVLKTLKLNESTISTILGALVIVVVATLVVRYFKNLNTGKLPTENGSSTSQEEQVPSVGSSYTVQEGDTLWSIAEEAFGSGYNWVDIAKANNLSDANQIDQGEKLTIPSVEARVKTVSEHETPEQKSDSIAGATYTVVHGDNLWDIAVRAYGDGYMWSSIAHENNLTNPNVIHAGNILSLPR